MNKFNKILSNEKNHKILIPLIAVFLGFLTGSVIMALTGQNPGVIYKSLLKAVLGINTKFIGTGKAWFNPRYVGEYFVAVMPIVMTGLSVAFAFRTGLFNIGAEGQLLVGGLFSVVAAVLLEGTPSFILIPLVILAGILGGGLWGFIPGLLKAKYNVHEVVVTIMLNYVGLYFSNYVIKALPGSTLLRSCGIVNGSLGSEVLSKFTNHSRFHWGFIIVVLALVVFFYIINKTTFGYELRAVGYNPHASKYAGIKVDRNAVLSMTIAGAFAGLAGTLIATGTFNYGRILQGFENYGFNGIVVALVGGNTAIGTLLGGMLLGGLSAAQPIMQSGGIPRDVAIIIVSAIIIFVAMQNGIKIVLKKLAKAGYKDEGREA